MDKDFLNQIKDGDESAFEAVFNEYYESLAYFALKYVGNAQVAEDIVQDLFVKIWANRHSLRIEQSLSSYLYGAVKNASFNHLKSQNIRSEYASNQILPSEADSFIPNEIDASDLSLLIETAIFSMPKERQKIFRMSREEGMKYAEIAAKQEISVKTVEAQMGKALQFMRSMLKDFLVFIPGIFLYP
jgi:RNA polymerase sigma-70 factor (ECF subfamily)